MSRVHESSRMLVYIWAAGKNGKLGQMHLPPHILSNYVFALHMRVLVHLGGINKMDKCISVTGRRKKSGPNKWFQNFKSV